MMAPETSTDLGWSPRNPSERVLMMLKMHGTLTAAAVGEKLGTTGEAARQHLTRLATQGLVVSKSTPSGVGRPTQQWSLTAAGQAQFPDTHAALTVQILDSVRSSLGEEALDRIIAQRESETRSHYAAAMAACGSLRERVAALAELRSAEGYMAEWQEEDDGSILLIENHCPICAAATFCQGFCRAEKAVFQAVLGPQTDVERDEHIIEGGRRCTYVIRPA